MDISQIIEIQIEDMLDDGRAFGRYDGCAVFVSGGCSGAAGAVIGDTVRARVNKIKKSTAEASLVSIAAPSPDRIPAECPYAAECGGCTLQELSYDAQKRLKTGQVRSKLQRLGGLEDPVVRDMIGADTLRYYRNKAVFAVGPHGEVGFRKGKSHFVIDIDDCMLQTDAAMVCADALRTFLGDLMSKAALPVNPIKQMTVRTAFGTGEVMVILDTGNAEIPELEKLVEMLDDAVYSLVEQGTVPRSVNTDQNSFDDDDVLNDESVALSYSLESVAVIHNGKCRIVAGKPTITETFRKPDGRSLDFEISPQSFYQVNPEQMVRLYDKAAEYALGQGTERESLTILDLYCGAGTIGLWLLEALRHKEPELFERTRVIGIESVKPAVLDANRNSVINGIVNTRYICGKAEEELPGMMGLAKLYKWNEVNERVEREPEITIGCPQRTDSENAESESENKKTAAFDSHTDKADVAILDPPRAGCDEALLNAVVTAAPDRIVYVSCDPGTLARDIKYLTAHGYEFIEATPIDQFPLTSAIECVCLLDSKMRR